MSGQQHVVMTVGNAFAPDNRVRKSAQTLREAGFRVTVLALAPPHSGQGHSGRDSGPRRETRDGVDIIHVPVSWRQRELVRARVNWVVGRPTLELNGKRAKGLTERISVLRRIEEGDMALAATGRPRPPAAVTGLGHSARMAGLHFASYAVRGRRRLARNKADGSPRVLERTRSWWAATPIAARPQTHFAELLDYENAFGPVLDSLDFDLLHAHDVYMLGLCARAVARRRVRGDAVGLLYDAHEFTPGLAHYTIRRITAMSSHEARYIQRADEVVTVSGPIAERMQELYRLTERPTVVHNTPFSTARDVVVRPRMREQLGIAPGVPIVVYSGNVGNGRGEKTLVEAMEYLRGDVHVVLVTNATRRYLDAHWQLAESFGALDRFHTADYVPATDIVSYLSDATIGYHGLVPGPENHEMALPNKLYEYMHAGLPLVVSEARALRGFVEENGIGLSFRTDDPAHLAKQIHAVLDSHAELAEKLKPGSPLLAEYSWEVDGARLLAAYRRMAARNGLEA